MMATSTHRRIAVDTTSDLVADRGDPRHQAYLLMLGALTLARLASVYDPPGHRR
jgi:hypothetical protein